MGTPAEEQGHPPDAARPPDARAGADAPRGGRKAMLLRLDPAVHDALAAWASDELRSSNAHIELLLREALRRAGRLPRDARPLPRRGRPPKPTT